MRYPKTIRFDRSDDFVFERAARAGEPAVSGAFAFAVLEGEAASWPGKVRQAFANGLLGTESFGWSTFVAVAEIADAEYDAAVERLAGHLLAHYGAPDPAAARAAALAEAEFAAGLCEHKLNTLLAVERTLDAGGIVESFKVVRPPARDVMAGRVWDVLEGDDDD